MSLLIITFTFLETQSQARELGHVEIYYRCYAHMVRSRPLDTDPRLLAVKAGTKSPVDACMELFDLASMNKGLLASEQIPSVDDSNITIGSQIVKTFHDFHRTQWLQSDNVAAFSNRATNTEWIIDSTDSAYFLTRALFDPEVEYKTVVTSSENIAAIRNSPVDVPWRLRTDWSNTFGYSSPVKLDEYFASYQVDSTPVNILFSPEPLEFGRLIGFKIKTPQPFPTPPGGGAPLSSDIHALLGGGAGALSTPAYFILNNGHSFQKTNGGAVVPRRWSKAVLRDFLCRELPVIRMSDAEPYVQSDSSLSFRKNGSCMQCHHTMDNLAIATRNYAHTESGGYTAEGYNAMQFVRHYLPEDGPYSGPLDGSDTFHKTNPTGRFVFRSYDGNLINQELSNVSDIGTVLAESKDLYACAAKRYFEFFTHVDASIDDIADPDTAVILNKKDLDYRNFVISLGNDLKTNHDLRELIRKIIASDYYRQSDFGAWE